MYYAEVSVTEPVEKLLGDWDLLDERVVKKLTAFKELNDTIIGEKLGRRLFDNVLHGFHKSIKRGCQRLAHVRGVR